MVRPAPPVDKDLKREQNAAVTFVLQVIESLIQHNTTPLIVKRAMCTFLSISWDRAIEQYKRLKRLAAAVAKRGLDTSACTVVRVCKHERVDAEDGVLASSMDAGEDAEDVAAGVIAGAVEGAGVVAGAADGAGKDAGEGDGMAEAEDFVLIYDEDDWMDAGGDAGPAGRQLKRVRKPSSHVYGNRTMCWGGELICYPAAYLRRRGACRSRTIHVSWCCWC